MVMAGDVVGGFRLLETVKTHGEITVCRAERLIDGTIVALKLAAVGTSDARRLEHEAAAYRLVVSRRTVACADFGVDGAQVYLAVQWYAGGALKDRLARGRMDEYEVVCLAKDLLVALHDIHKSGLIHRDVKPSNVFFDEIGEARLGDFGVALLPGEKTKPGVIVGTTGYLSPEQATGSKIDERSDLYALGLVLKESVGEATASFHRFLNDLTAKDPALRPRSALAALERLY